MLVKELEIDFMIYTRDFLEVNLYQTHKYRETYTCVYFVVKWRYKMTTRKQKQQQYKSRYGDIPVDYAERLNWMIDKYNLSPAKMDEILLKRQAMLNNMFYYDYNIVELLEEPEGASRPRVRVLKNNYNKLAAQDPMSIHVYVPGAADDNNYMRRLVSSELSTLDSLIATPCDIEYNAYLKTPSALNITDTFLAEIGLIRPPFSKPDWDNIGKKYCDMFNYNVWIDDTLVIDGHVHKYYSILPRVEIKLRYLNCVYTKYFYNAMISRKGFEHPEELHYLDGKGELV